MRSSATDQSAISSSSSSVIERRFALPEVSLAEVAVAVSGGRLLASGWPGEWVQHESTLPPRQMRP
ncbi:hypothetical protein FVA95_29595 [Pseudonocardia sp. EV170527-09]|nr:hypothetical protein FVA95_29595 [Pseudonocardia sp. EV170527-09]OCB59926.1 hypothetical protein A9X02_07100 [Mycobacterium malmoense]